MLCVREELRMEFANIVESLERGGVTVDANVSDGCLLPRKEGGKEKGGRELSISNFPRET